MKLEISNYECEKLGLEKNILLLADLFFHTFVHSKIAQKYCLDQKRNPYKFQLIIYFFCKKPNAKLFLSNFRRLSLSNLPPAKQNQTKTMATCHFIHVEYTLAIKQTMKIFPRKLFFRALGQNVLTL